MSEETGNRKLGPGGWFLIAAMLVLLIVSVVYAIQVWTSMEGVSMSGWGWAFLGLGIVVSVGLGAGLMALVFYSSRHDYDR